MYKEIIKPTLVLIIIVGVMSGLLAFTYNVAGIKDLSTGISQEDLNAMTQAVLPGATELKKANITVENVDILGVYKDEGGKGAAIFLQSKGYDDEPMRLVIGIDTDGRVAGINVFTSNETPGLGTKAQEPSYLAQFIGKNGELKFKEDNGDIDTISGATKSSQGILNGVNLALQTYDIVKGDL